MAQPVINICWSWIERNDLMYEKKIKTNPKLRTDYEFQLISSGMYDKWNRQTGFEFQFRLCMFTFL